MGTWAIPEGWLSAAFDRAVSSPRDWARNARALKNAADALGDLWLRDAMRSELGHIASGPVFLMLAGLTIENLIKAIAVGRRGLRASDGQLPKPLKTHDSLKLIREEGIALSAEEARFVERLRVYVEWAGRYPTPRKATEMEAKLTSSRDFGAVPRNR